MAREADRPMWKEQRPWFEIWFAVVLDASKRRALWVRQTLFVPKRGDARASVWGAWFDADATPPSRAAKRREPIGSLVLGDPLITIADCTFGLGGAKGNVDGIAWDATWSGGKPVHGEIPAWVPAPTHARAIVNNADATASVRIGDATHALTGRAIAMHLWGKRRVPTLHWIWAPWLGDGSLEMTAISLRDRFALGLSSLELDAPTPLKGRPATAAHPHGLVTATVAGTRKLVHARAWAEPAELVGYAYRDTDDRDLMVAQSDIGSAQLEVFARAAPGVPWKPVEERRSAGGVAVEIHQRHPLPGIDYLAWDATRGHSAHAPTGAHTVPAPRRTDEADWPEVRSIVALGLTYADHIRETGQTIDPTAPPVAFAKHVRSFRTGAASVIVPASTAIAAELDALEPELGATLAKRFAVIPAVMDYEGELAVVALGDIDLEALVAGTPQPFGLAAANDLTARIVQVLGEGRERPYDYWAAAKSFAGFLPCAEHVWAPPGGIAAIPELVIATRVNGEERQRASTRELIYDLRAIVRTAQAQLGRPLARGDVISTGTPAGVGLRLSPLRRRVAAIVKDRMRKVDLLVSTYATSNALLRPGDVVEVDAGPAGRVRTRLGV
jgi:2-keto-4-pentenoate hydratase/2-oxohepta-3-ene-1,7-dioic acid hydratase in catechol pathway